MLSGTNIRNTKTGVPDEFPLECGIELLDAGTLKVKRYSVSGQSGKVCRVANNYRPASERSNTTWIDTARQTSSVSFLDRLVEGIRRECITHSLSRWSWIIDTISAADYILIT